GDYVFTNYYNLTNVSNTGVWNLTVKIYNKDGTFLNETYYLFNITSELYVNTTILNPTGLQDRIVNATVTVKNYRQDRYIPGANVTCKFDSTEVPQENITDNGDGTYNVTFQAPSQFGLYTLNCTARKDGNSGYGTDNFTSEAAKTNVSHLHEPQVFFSYNVTLYSSENFDLTVTLRNTGNSTAYQANFTITFPTNWTSNTTGFENCGTIMIDYTCVRTFNVTIPANTTPGHYLINVTSNWTNLDNSTSSNQSYTNVTVMENPVLRVPEDQMQAILGPGNETTAGNFTIYSEGNDDLENITFHVIGLDDFQIEFIPENISSLPVGFSQSVQVNVTASSSQAPGIYNGTINVTSNRRYELIEFQIIVTGTNLTLYREPESFLSYNITWLQNESFELFVNVTNAGNVTAFNTRINLSYPSSWMLNQTNPYLCGNLTKDENCTVTYLVTIMNGTRSGNYTINITIMWDDIGIGTNQNRSYTWVNVSSNPIMSVLEDEITSEVEHGNEKTIGVIHINSTGNDPVYNITFNITGLNDFSPEVIPSFISNLSGGESTNVMINVTVPSGYNPGTYNGTINVTSDNDGYKVVNLTIIVPVNGSWYAEPTYCMKAQEPSQGTVCEIEVNNTGNIPLNFTINQTEANPSWAANLTWANVSNFTVEKQSVYVFNISYDVTGQPKQYYNYTYLLNATTEDATPDNVSITIILNPFVSPLVTVSVTPNMTEQGGSVTIRANVTSQSGADITYVIANVTKPDGTYDEKNMTRLYLPECILAGKTCWSVDYPSDWGNTTQYGNYTVLIFAMDEIGINGTESTTLKVYTKLDPLLFTLSPVYSNFYGDITANVYYRSRNLEGTPLGNTNLYIEVLNSNNETVLNKTYTTQSDGFIRNNQGGIYVPVEIKYDYPAGNYTIVANSTYYDPLVDLYVNNSLQHRFEVIDRPVTYGFLPFVKVFLWWYQNNVIRFIMWFIDSTGELVDPERIDLTVLDPADNIYFTANETQMNKESAGVYTYDYAMPVNSPIGVYTVNLTASNGSVTRYAFDYFRVSTGGPYDVIINLLEHEVTRGDFLDFELYVENKGDVSDQDVNITYWVTDGNQTWDMNTFSANIAAGENKTFTTSVYIFQSQPLGFYTLVARVVYDPYNNLYAEANATFQVVEGAPPGPPGPPAPAPGAPGAAGGEVEIPVVAKKEITIEEYPTELAVEVGYAKFPNIKIRNTGDVNLTDIRLMVSGLPSEWYEITPQKIDLLEPNQTAVFTLKILVPPGTKTEEHIVKITAYTNETSSEKTFVLLIFTSRQELLQYELARLKAKLEELEEKTDEAGKTKDVTDVLKVLDEIKKQIDLAEGYLIEKKYDAALNAIYAGWNLVKRAEYLLSIAPPLSPFAMIPWWLIIIIVIFVVIIALVIFFLKRMTESIKTLVKGRMAEARVVTGMIGKEVDVDALKIEREKLRRTLNLLERQYKEGIISREAYLSLRKRTEQRITDIERKIRHSLHRV
ncbi:MAG: hypothetical protein DRP15_01360, partial [Candidatus Aenigmatarchaeota archaeon]